MCQPCVSPVSVLCQYSVSAVLALCQRSVSAVSALCRRCVNTVSLLYHSLVLSQKFAHREGCTPCAHCIFTFVGPWLTLSTQLMCFHSVLVKAFFVCYSTDFHVHLTRLLNKPNPEDLIGFNDCMEFHAFFVNLRSVCSELNNDLVSCNLSVRSGYFDVFAPSQLVMSWDL